MKKYIFKTYNPDFPNLYKAEEKRLKNILGNIYPIDHIGSTAIEGLGGKGIIDIMVTVPKDKLSRVSSLVQQAGYEFKESGGNEERLFHQKDLIDSLGKKRRYHLHITLKDSNTYKETLAFRDYLRKHPKEAKHYAKVKLAAAKNSNQEKEKYMFIKEPIIQKLLKKALKEY